MKKLITVLALSAALSAPAWAATQTVTLSVTGMTCATCPITVKIAMSGVEGVQSVEVDFDSRSAIVIFDPALTNAVAIAEASAQAGYPADVRG